MDRENMKLSYITDATFSPILPQKPEWKRLVKLAEEREEYSVLYNDITNEFFDEISREIEQGRPIIMELYGPPRCGKSQVGIRIMERFQHPLEPRRIVRRRDEIEKLIETLQAERPGERIGWVMVDEQQHEHGEGSGISRDEQKNREEILAEKAINWLFISPTRRQHDSSFIVLEPIRSTWAYNVPDKDLPRTEYRKRAEKLVREGGATECFVWLKPKDELIPWGIVCFSAPKNVDFVEKYLISKDKYNDSIIKGENTKRWEEKVDAIISDPALLKEYIFIFYDINKKGELKPKPSRMKAYLRRDRELSKHIISKQDYDYIVNAFEASLMVMEAKGEINIKEMRMNGI